MIRHRSPEPEPFLSPVPLPAATRRALAETLGDAPQTVIATHLLRHDLADAFATGVPPDWSAVVLRNLAFNPDELIGFGPDAGAIWRIVRRLPEWTCILADTPVAGELSDIIAEATNRPVRLLDDVSHVLLTPAPALTLPGVRLLGPADEPLLTALPPDLRAAGFRTVAALLRHGVVAAAIIDGAIAAVAYTSAITARHADLAVNTRPPWRGRGFARATAALVAARLQAAGLTPVWSAGATNAASLRVAARLGFVEVGRRTYVIPLA